MLPGWHQLGGPSPHSHWMPGHPGRRPWTGPFFWLCLSLFLPQKSSSFCTHSWVLPPPEPSPFSSGAWPGVRVWKTGRPPGRLPGHLWGLPAAWVGSRGRGRARISGLQTLGQSPVGQGTEGMVLGQEAGILLPFQRPPAVPSPSRSSPPRHWRPQGPRGSAFPQKRILHVVKRISHLSALPPRPSCQPLPAPQCLQWQPKVAGPLRVTGPAWYVASKMHPSLCPAARAELPAADYPQVRPGHV